MIERPPKNEQKLLPDEPLQLSVKMGLERLKPPSILVVDDDEDLGDLIVDILVETNAHVRQVNSGEKALSILQKDSFDIVISDFIMHGMSGVELLKKIRETQAPHLIFLMMSGDRRVNLEDLYSRGIAALIRKPFDFDELPRIVYNLLYNRNQIDRPGGKRLPAHIPVQFRFSTQALKYEGRVLNLSSKGMLIETQSPCPVGPDIEFKLKYDFQKPIEGRAKVRWQHKWEGETPKMGFGIEFHTISNESRSEIEKLMEKLETNLGMVT